MVAAKYPSPMHAKKKNFVMTVNKLTENDGPPAPPEHQPFKTKLGLPEQPPKTKLGAIQNIYGKSI